MEFFDNDAEKDRMGINKSFTMATFMMPKLTKYKILNLSELQEKENG